LGPPKAIVEIAERLKRQGTAVLGDVALGGAVDKAKAADALAGVTFLAFGYRLLPGGRKGSGPAEAAFRIEDYTTEAALPAGSPMAGKTVADLEAMGDGEVTVTAIIREHFRRYAPSAHWMFYPDDVLILQGGQAALERVIDQGGRRCTRCRLGDRRGRGGDRR
jgi:hypothetical protein